MRNKTLNALCQQFDTIELSEMKEIQLMNRIDTKYIVSFSQLIKILELASDSYRIQVVNNERISGYDTLYYDTASCDMYLLHHNRKLIRQKIRTRCYVQSKINFLEIKNKNNKGRTHKVRVSIDKDDFYQFSENVSATKLMHQHSKYEIDEIIPTLNTRFNRITLVNKAKTERLTIDMDLQFENIINKCIVSKPNLVIIELKQDGFFASPMAKILEQLRIKKFKISKYCIGTAFTNPQIKKNRFKFKMNMIDKLSQS